ncbi:MAG: FAD-binding oxidoreductase [Corynebacterium variabile]|uniref:FAD-binding oxidoreductase n=1 Tax=Corynebacterium variabile TaxID=1727 RepID=UPI003FB912AA
MTTLHSLLTHADVPVLPAGTPDALAAESGYQLLCPHRPEATARPTTTGQVSAAVRAAVESGVPYSVINSGHGRRDSLDGGLLISLDGLRSASLDGRTVRVGGGTRWGDVVAQTASAGLAVPHGSAPGVGVVGYLLGGGYSIFARSLGLGINAVRSMTVVDGHGEIHRWDLAEIRELFADAWRERVDPGIVTEVTLEATSARPLTAGGFCVVGARVRELMQVFCGWAEELPEDATCSLGVMRRPSGPVVGHVRLTATGDRGPVMAVVDRLRSRFPVTEDDGFDIGWDDPGRIYREPASARPYVGDNLVSTSAPDLDAFWSALSGEDGGPVILDLRQIGGQTAHPDRDGLSAPGQWVTGLVAPTTDARQEVDAEGVTRLLAAAVPEALGSAENFTYGVGAGW